MKMTTVLWAKFESVGYPKLTQKLQGTNTAIAKAFILWLANVKMGSQLRITMTRSESELELGRGVNMISNDILSEFEDALSVEGVE